MTNKEVEAVIEDILEKNKELYKRMAIKEECQFRITVYERDWDIIAVKDNDPAQWEAAGNVNEAIKKIKRSFPELQDEEGVKYYPLDKYHGRSKKKKANKNK